jgi:hypothetical protein
MDYFSDPIFWLLLLGFALIYGVVRIFLPKNPRWRFVVSFILFLTASALWLSISDYNPARFSRLFDTHIASMGKAEFSYRGARALSSELYSLSVHPLPEAIRNRFSHPDSRLFQDYPLAGSRLGWLVGTWKETPITPDLQKYTDSAFNALPEDYAKSPDLQRRLNDARAVLNQPGAYYAFYFLSNNATHAVDLYLVDLPGNKLYFLKNYAKPEPSPSGK